MVRLLSFLERCVCPWLVASAGLFLVLYVLLLKVWLLHDFDHIHKWRCCFAWASKAVSAPEKTSRLDLLGTSAVTRGLPPARDNAA